MAEYKFIITFYNQVCLILTEVQKLMLVFHELLHIDIDFNKIKKYDIGDHYILVSKYSINWDIDPNLVNLLEDDNIL